MIVCFKFHSLPLIDAAMKTLVSPLKWQTRVVSCFIPPPPTALAGAPSSVTSSGFAVGSVEGRVAIQ